MSSKPVRHKLRPTSPTSTDFTQSAVIGVDGAFANVLSAGPVVRAGLHLVVVGNSVSARRCDTLRDRLASCATWTSGT